MKVRKLEMGFYRHGYTVVENDTMYEVDNFMQAVIDAMRPIREAYDAEFNEPHKLDLWKGYADIMSGEETGTFLFAEWHENFASPYAGGTNLDPTYVRTEGKVKTNMPEWLQVHLGKTEEEVKQMYKEQDESLKAFVKLMEEK